MWHHMGTSENGMACPPNNHHYFNFSVAGPYTENRATVAEILCAGVWIRGPACFQGWKESLGFLYFGGTQQRGVAT
jgi:hypothetical protein